MKIALLSYHFFNTTAEGLVTAKLARALADYGHTITVLTSQLNSLEGDCVKPVAGPLAGLTIMRIAPDQHAVPSWWRRLHQLPKRTLGRGKILAIPNLLFGCSADEWAWVRAVAKKTLQIHNQDITTAFDLLHSRINHPISHYAALEVKRNQPELPWCAYFSDPWPHHHYPEPYRFTVGPLSRVRLDYMLNKMLATAGSVIFPSKRLCDHMLSDARKQFQAKAFVAAHLASTWDQSSDHPLQQLSGLRIRHAGFLMRERRVEPIYDALRILFATHPASRTHLTIEFAGRYDKGNMLEPPDDLCDSVTFAPYMTPDASWQWIRAGSIALLVEAQMREGIFFPSKLADYLAIGKPILALSPRQGVTADLLAQGGGLVAEPQDPHDIAQKLKQIYAHWQHGTLATLAPTQEQAEIVAPKTIIPIYEQAFRHAILASKS